MNSSKIRPCGRPLAALLLVASVAGSGGCGKEGEAARAKIGEAALAVKDYAISRKAEFIRLTSDQLKELEPQIADMKQRAAALSGDARAKLDESIAKLEERTKSLRAKLAELGDASADTWIDARDRFGAALEDLKVGFRAAWSDLRR